MNFLDDFEIKTNGAETTIDFKVISLTFIKLMTQNITNA